MQLVGAGAADLLFLERMWHAAAFWQPDVVTLPPDVARSVPEIARYIAGWGRPADTAVVAWEGGERVGAAWYRLFSSAEPGYGFVAEDVPEVAVAVEPAWRRRGVATALLESLLDVARRAGFAAVSLSVDEANHSRRIYRRLGFVDVAHDDGSYVMLRRLDDVPAP